MDKYKNIKLEHQLCFPLYAVSREVIKLYKPILDQYNLTYTQYITLLVLWEEEKISVKQIGHKLHLDSGTLTPLLKKLDKMGMIVKYRDQQDDRVVIIELTDKGRNLKEEILEVPEQVYCKIGIEQEELISLKKSLDRILKKLTN